MSLSDWERTRMAVLVRDKFICAYCVDDATQVDHIIPVCQGGGDDPNNLVAACSHCNASKGGLTPYEWCLRDRFALPPWWYKTTSNEARE